MSQQSVVARVRDDGRSVRVSIPERFDHTLRRQFRDVCSGADPEASIIVDFQSTKYVDSSGLGMLLLLRDQYKDVTFVNTTNAVRELLAVVRFDKLFNFA